MLFKITHLIFATFPVSEGKFVTLDRDNTLDDRDLTIFSLTVLSDVDFTSCTSN